MNYTDDELRKEYAELVNLLTYRRPSSSVEATMFATEFIMPVMGPPDIDGNYYCSIADPETGTPRVAFMAHYDTVHYDGGRQVVDVNNHLASLPDTSKSSCLGADCTTGVWLILEMIRNNVPGHYMIFADEEIGCYGSRGFAKNNKEWIMEDIDACISFDRYGTGSVITHQSSMRTASETFSRSLSGILGLGMKSDDGGSFTDSNEFVDIIHECTNISVGYMNQHSKRETQDLAFAVTLRDALLSADWSKLQIERERGDQDYDYPDWWVGGGYRHKSYGSNYPNYNRQGSLGQYYKPIRPTRYDRWGAEDAYGDYDAAGNLVIDSYNKYGEWDPDGEYDALGNKVFSSNKRTPRTKSGSSERVEMLQIMADDPNGFIDACISFGLTSDIIKEFLTEESLASQNRSERYIGEEMY